MRRAILAFLLLLLVIPSRGMGMEFPGGGGGGTTTGVPTVINVTDAAYGAKCDGSTDDTTALQAALDAASGNGNEIYTPNSSCIFSSTLVISHSGTVIRGTGRSARWLLSSAAGATVDMVKIYSATADILGVTLEDFYIGVQSGTPGRDALVIDTSTHAVYQVRINRMIISAAASGGWGIRSVNATPIVNGFFTSTIQNSQIVNGITLQNAGDAIIIEHNIQTGANTCLVATFVTGAADLRYMDNNCTTTAGAISLTTNTYHAIIESNEIATTGTVAGATINLTGNHIKLIRNQVNTASTIQINASSTYTELLGNSWDGTTTVSDAGTDTFYFGNVTDSTVGMGSFLLTTNTTQTMILQRVDSAHTSLPVLQIRRLRADSTAPNAGTGAQFDFMIEGNTNGVPYVTTRLESLLEQNQTDGTTTRDAKLRISTILNNSLTGYLDLMSSGNFQPVTNGATILGGAALGFGRLYMDYTNTATIGAVTINKAVGRANIAAGAASVVVTNSVVTAASHCFATLQANDTTALYVRSCVTGSGTMTITTTANATANTAVDFLIINAD